MGDVGGGVMLVLKCWSVDVALKLLAIMLVGRMSVCKFVKYSF